MKKKVADIKRFGLLLIGAIAMLCSCRDEVYPGSSPDSEERTRNIIISLTVQQPGVESPLSRNQEKDYDYELGLTEAECQINSLTLLMMGIDDEGRELFETWQTVDKSQLEEENGIYKVTFTLEGITGTKRFYVGANMKQEHINAFWEQDRVFDAGEGESGHNIVGSLMDVNHDANGNGVGSNIVMMGAVKNTDGGKDIVIPGETNSAEGDDAVKIEIADPIELTRTVAKVLLTCVPKPGSDEGYVNVVDAKDAESNSTGNTGWIQFDHVNYMLNVLNRKTYLDYREEEDENGTTYLVDPNYKMSELIGPSESGTYGIKDLAAYRKEFLYYDTQQMVEMLNTDVQEHEEKSSEPCITRKATVYDENKVGKEDADEDHYTEGLYCTENMVHKDMDFSTDADFQSANRYVTTRIMIGAKYTPKKIYVAENNKLVLQDCETEEEAQGYLKEQTDGGLPGGDVDYLDGTFWRCIDPGNMQYYSLSGMKLYLSEHTNAQFERFDGGWGYYYTYIDGDVSTDGVIGYEGKPRWGIKRNHYYILKVEKIIAPGSPFPGNETMRIHSELLDWVDKGESEVEVKVPQKSDGGEG